MSTSLTDGEHDQQRKTKILECRSSSNTANCFFAGLKPRKTAPKQFSLFKILSFLFRNKGPPKNQHEPKLADIDKFELIIDSVPSSLAPAPLINMLIRDERPNPTLQQKIHSIFVWNLSIFIKILFSSKPKIPPGSRFRSNRSSSSKQNLSESSASQK